MGWDYRITPLPATITTEAYVSGLYDFIHSNGTIQEVVGTAKVGSTERDSCAGLGLRARRC
jgi:hypothetical protein